MNEEIKPIFDLLEETNRYVPKDSILDELKMIIERLRFSELNRDLSQRMKTEEVKNKLSFIFKEEISNQMLDFLYKLSDQSNLKVVLDNSAQLLIDAADKYYSQVKEVSVTVAVEISNDFKNWLGTKISEKFTTPTRITFAVDDSITAGLIISSEESYRDFSFKKIFLPLAQNRLRESFTKIEL